jgi:hypothetical protein
MRTTDDYHLAMAMWVVEADFSKDRWLEVKDQGNQVLFLGTKCEGLGGITSLSLT